MCAGSRPPSYAIHQEPTVCPRPTTTRCLAAATAHPTGRAPPGGPAAPAAGRTAARPTGCGPGAAPAGWAARAPLRGSGARRAGVRWAGQLAGAAPSPGSMPSAGAPAPPRRPAWVPPEARCTSARPLRSFMVRSSSCSWVSAASSEGNGQDRYCRRYRGGRDRWQDGWRKGRRCQQHTVHQQAARHRWTSRTAAAQPARQLAAPTSCTSARCSRRPCPSQRLTPVLQRSPAIPSMPDSPWRRLAHAPRPAQQGPSASCGAGGRMSRHA